MNHFAPPLGHGFPWYVRLIFFLQRRKYGRELESARLWARMPKAFLALTLLFRALDRKSSPLEPALRSLVLVRLSQLNSCAFCVDLNSASALNRWVSHEKLNALAQSEGSALFDAREKAALAFAGAVTLGNKEKDKALSALKEHFSDQAIVELTALVAFQNMSTKFNPALDVVPQGFCTAISRVETSEKALTRPSESI